MHCNNGLNNKLVESLVENKVAQETGDLKYLQDSMYDFVSTLKEIILGEYSPEFFNKYVDEALKLHGSNLEEFLKIPKMGLELRQALENIDDAIDTSNQEFRDNLVLLLDRFQTTLDNMEYEARDPYDTAVELGFTGTKQEWLKHLEGDSAYEIAVKNGYEGTQSEWLKYIRADGFIQSIQQFATNDSETKVQIPDYGTINSLQGYIKELFEKGGLPATPFATKALMTASALVDGDFAQVTDDTVNNGLYVKTAGTWVKSAYDPVVLANTYTDAKQNDAKSEVLAEVFNKVILETTRNLFDGNYLKGGIRTIGSGDTLYGQWVARPDLYTGNNVAIVSINGGETYSVKAHSGNLTGDFRAISYKEKPEILPDINGTYEKGVVLYESRSVKECTVTVPDDAKYLLILPTNNGSEPKLQVEVGSTHTDYITNAFVVNTKPLTAKDFSSLSTKGVNLFNGEYKDKLIYGRDLAMALRHNFDNLNGKIAEIKVEPLTTYTFSCATPYLMNRCRIGLLNNKPQYGNTNWEFVVDGAVYSGDKYSSPITFTTDAETEYVVIYVSNNGQEPKIQLEVGDTATEFEDYFSINHRFLPTIATKRSQNLFDGVYYKGNLKSLYEGDLDDEIIEDSYYLSENTGDINGLYSVISVKDLETYTLTFHDDVDVDIVRVVLFSEKPVMYNENPVGGVAGVLISDDNKAKSITFKTLSDTAFVAIQVGSQNRPRKMQLEIGDVSTEYKEHFIIPSEKLEAVSNNSLGGIELAPKRKYNLFGDIHSLFTLDTPLDSYHADPLGITSAEQIALYDDLVSRHPDFFVRNIIGTDDYGYTMYSYETMPPKHYNTPGQSLDIDDPNIEELNMPKFVITSGVHGLERSAVFATYFFFKEMLDNPRNDKTLNLLKRNVKFVVAPINNNSGFDDALYETRNGGNINRDFPTRGKATLTETQNLISFFKQNSDMDYYFDFHNSRGASGVLGYILTDLPELKSGGITMYQELGNHWQNNYPAMPQDPYKLWGFSMDLIEGTCAKYCQDVLGVRSVIFETRYFIQGLGGWGNQHHEENVRLGVECLTNMVLCCLRDSV